jgi:hypothetical protein
MIKIESLDIKSRGFQILAIQDYFDLTTAEKTYPHSPMDGGIVVIPELTIQNIKDGKFYISQICKNHQLNITSDTGKQYIYNNDEVLRDSEGPSACHYMHYHIIDNKIKSWVKLDETVVFHDSPYKGLFPWWQRVDYEIEFQTWFQYSYSPEFNIDVIPLISFDWILKASAIKTNDIWKLENSKFSDEAEIKKSIKEFSIQAPPLIPCDLKHLATEVRSFGEQHPELRKDFQTLKN